MWQRVSRKAQLPFSTGAMTNETTPRQSNFQDRGDGKTSERRGLPRSALLPLMVLPLGGALVAGRLLTKSRTQAATDVAFSSATPVASSEETGGGAQPNANSSEHQPVEAETPPAEPLDETPVGEIPTLDVGPNVPLETGGVAERAGDVMVDAEAGDEKSRTSYPGD